MTHPHEEREDQAAFLELFFDLVFVYAITQVAAFIHRQTNGPHGVSPPESSR